jgi:hypothetical protein
MEEMGGREGEGEKREVKNKERGFFLFFSHLLFWEKKKKRGSKGEG